MRLAPLFMGAASCFAQLFCPAGVPADGFVDWTKLGTAPGGGAAFSRTIPVSGVSGLNVTVSAPAFTPPYQQPNYSVVDSSKLLLGGNPRTITLGFSKPVRGVRLVAGTTGRFLESFQLKLTKVNESYPFPPTAQTQTSQYVLNPLQTTLTPLELEDAAADILSMEFTFNGDPEEYFSFTINNLRVDSGSQADPAKQVPTSGLRQWFRADNGVLLAFPSESSVTGWGDNSPAGNGAVSDSPGTNPTYIAQDGSHCKPAVAFNGHAFLKANLPINGWNQMTIFLVARASADPNDGSHHSLYPALSWPQEEGPWGMTYLSPFQSHLAFRFGTGQANYDPEIARPTNVGADFTVTTAIHNQTVDSVFVNSRPLYYVSGRNSTLTNIGSLEQIGVGSQNTFFTGEISEILIYDRALGNAERATVESYLEDKYGTF